MREEILASATTHDTNAGGYELSDLEEIEFFSENFLLEMDATFRGGRDTHFSPKISKELETGGGGSTGNPIVSLE